MDRLINDGLVDALKKEMARREQEDKLPAFFLTVDQIRQLQAAIEDCEFQHELEQHDPQTFRDHWPMLVRRLTKRIDANQEDLFAGTDAHVMMTAYFERLETIQRRRDRLDEEARDAWLIPESILDMLQDCHRFGHAAWLFPHTIRYLVKAMNNREFQLQPRYKYGTEECDYVARMLETLTQVLSVNGEIALKGPALNKFHERVVSPMRTMIQVRKAASGHITDDMVEKVCKTLREHRGVSDIALAGHVLNTLSDDLSISGRAKAIKKRGEEPMTITRQEYESLFEKAAILDSLLSDDRYRQDTQHMVDLVSEDNPEIFH